MKNKLIEILDSLYNLTNEEKDKFLKSFNKLNNEEKDKIIVTIYKRMEWEKKNLKNLNLKMKLTINSLNELIEKRNNVNLDF